MTIFTIKHTQGLARVGTIHTPHGDIQTPAFVGAATRATVKALTMSEMRTLGSQAILANTYHLLLAPGPELIQQAGGLANFSAWQGPTFTDSGGFQIFSLPDVKISDDGARFKSHIDGRLFEMTPESSMLAQWQIGADIHMAFDQLAKSNDYADMQLAMQRTHHWLERSVTAHLKLRQSRALKAPDQFLYAVVQGGTFLDLRTESARFCAAQPVDGFGIGGVFTADGMTEMLQAVTPLLPTDRPRHLLGMGQEPRDLFVGAWLGMDTFDCVGPTRLARNGAVYTLDGRLNLKNARFRTDFTPIMPDCTCETCQHHTRAYLHHLFKVDEISAKVLASIHNEHFIVHLVDQIRASLLDGSFQTYKTAFLNRYYH